MAINDFEITYSKNTPIAHRKKYAQFFTPPQIADLMVLWLLKNYKLCNVLEPAFGLGIFSRILLNYKSDLNIKGFEIDSKIFGEAKKIFSKKKSVNLHLEDYMYNDWDNKYDGIICNPPYQKFHDYDNKPVLDELKKRLSLHLNGFTNLYALFILKSIYQLNNEGRAAYIIPSEFLNSDYGKKVKRYLVNSKFLRNIIVINFEENVFDDVLTTACILLLANDNNDQATKFCNISTLDDLGQVRDYILNYPNHDDKNSIDVKTLNPELKWRFYYQEQNSKKYKKVVPFSRFGKVMRGIATGANKYFTFNKSKAEKYGIPSNYLLPCITKSANINTPFFLEQNFGKLVHSDEDAFLFNAQDLKNEKVLEYIKLGEEKGVHQKFLTSRRSPWYSLEKRLPAPIWVSVFNRNGLKFIRNEANISNLTTFHCIYPTQDTLLESVDIDLLFAYLLTDTAKLIFEDNRREYGNGLKKFEPNDINRGMMLDLSILNRDKKRKILKYFHLYRKSIIENQEDTELLNKIDNIFTSEYT